MSLPQIPEAYLPAHKEGSFITQEVTPLSLTKSSVIPLLLVTNCPGKKAAFSYNSYTFHLLKYIYLQFYNQMGRGIAQVNKECQTFPVPACTGEPRKKTLWHTIHFLLQPP